MRRDDRDDPFEDIFREIERMMNDMLTGSQPTGRVDTSGLATQSSTHVDVYEDDDAVRVVADLPGVSKSDIAVRCDGEMVTLTAESETRQYDERVSLPAPVEAESGSATYNNGVLEVTFDRKASATDIDIE